MIILELARFLLSCEVLLKSSDHLVIYIIYFLIVSIVFISFFMNEHSSCILFFTCFLLSRHTEKYKDLSIMPYIEYTFSVLPSRTGHQIADVAL